MDIGSATASSRFRHIQIRTPRAKTSDEEVAKALEGRNELSSLSLNFSSLADKIKSIIDTLESVRTRKVLEGEGEGIASSDSSLDLNLVETAATLSSSEEINTTPTSYSTTEPSFQGSSSTTPLIGGTYNGSTDETLTFTATRGGFVGFLTPVEIEVRDEEGGLIDTASFSASYEEGTEITLSNGLTLSLSSGTLSQGDEFTLDVSASVGTAVNPDAAFDGTLDDSPRFDDGESVTAGSFFVNGTTINVAADDTITTVLEQINTSGAGVTATFNSTTEQIDLVADDLGSTGTILFENDTSGFLSATKLDSANIVAGNDDERASLLQDVAQFAAISAGTVTINGVQIAIDPESDSLNDVIDRINSSEAGVTAEYSEENGRFSLTSDDEAPVSLASDTAGFFAAVNIEEGTYSSATRVKTRTILDRSETERALDKIDRTLGFEFESLNSDTAKSEARIFLAQLKSGLTRVLRENGLSVNDSDNLDTGIGIVFKFEEESLSVEFDLDELNSARRSRSDRVRSLLKTTDGESLSIFEVFEAPITSIRDRVSSKLENLGNFLDLTA